MSFDVISVRRQFPILAEIIDGKPVHYLDNGDSAQTPTAVLDAVRAYETTARANVLRGVHRLAERATEGYENAREGSNALGPIFRRVFWFSVMGAAFIGVVALLQAYVFPGVIPPAPPRYAPIASAR